MINNPQSAQRCSRRPHSHCHVFLLCYLTLCSRSTGLQALRSGRHGSEGTRSPRADTKDVYQDYIDGLKLACYAWGWSVSPQVSRASPRITIM